MNWPINLLKHRNQKVKIILCLLIVIAPCLLVWAETSPSLSDLALDSFERQSVSGKGRDPFSASETISAQDISSLTLEGMILGPNNTQLALVSGQIAKPGLRLSQFLVKTIKPGSILLQSLDGEKLLKMKSLLNDTVSEGGQYEIYLEGADLKSAVRLIALAAHMNVIMPDELSGRASLIFHQISLKEALGAILRVNGFDYSEENNIVRIDKPDALGGGSSMESVQIPLRYATAKDMVTLVKPLLSDKGSVMADERSNTLSIKDQGALVEDVAAMIAEVDQRDPQVLIEARILDATKTFTRALGIQWGLNKSTGNVQGFGNADVGTSANSNNWNVNTPAGNPVGGASLLIGNLAGSVGLESQLSAAETNGSIHIISRPSVTTLNNMPAKIRSGVKIYVKSTSSINVGTTAGTASSGSAALQEIDTGVNLMVTPQITSDNMIKMKIDATESEADFSNKVDGIPSVIDNNASTTVLVHDGDTTVIGGLVKARKSKQTTGVPGISSVPVIGWLFKNKDQQRSDNELLILITPRVARDQSISMPAVEKYNQAEHDMYARPLTKKEKAAQKAEQKNQQKEDAKKVKELDAPMNFYDNSKVME